MPACQLCITEYQVIIQYEYTYRQYCKHHQPLMGKGGDYRTFFVCEILPLYSVKFDRVSYTVDFSIWIMNSYQSMQFIGSILKPIIWYYILCITHVFILTVYTNITIWWIKIPTYTVPGNHYMDFTGHLIWKAIPEVRNLTEVQGQISYSPQLSCSYRGIVGLKIDRCIPLIITGMQTYKQIL